MMGGASSVLVIGAGLAGCEAALQCVRHGVPVRLCEMRPEKMTEAHQTGDVAELVCSNSLKSDEPQNAHGLLKAELRILGSALLECAERARIPGGKALVVDRKRFSAEVQAALDQAGVEVVREEVTALPEATILKPEGRDTLPLARSDRDIIVIATGPLTSQSMVDALTALLGSEQLFFYDAIAPIVAVESLDMSRVFAGSRHGASEDYLNCPMSEDEYNQFIDALITAELHPVRAWDTVPAPVVTGSGAQSKLSDNSVMSQLIFFEGCLPIEEMARRGRMAPAFGPMKPVGLTDPRTGRQPFAVVQLRRENADGTMYNLVGFQTRLRHGEQARVFRMIPGLEKAEFLRYGSMHRNTYLDGPKVLLPTLQTRSRLDLFITGQLTGIEGYVESIGAGLVAGVNAARLAQGREPVGLPKETMMGSLLQYVAGETGPKGCSMTEVGGIAPRFQPMNANFGLLPPLKSRARGREKKRLLAERALGAVQSFAARIGFDFGRGQT